MIFLIETDLGMMLNAMVIIIIFFAGVSIFLYLNDVIERLPGNEALRFRGVARHFYENGLTLRALLIALFGGMSAAVLAMSYGMTAQALLVFLVLCDLTVITFIDADTQEIPPVLNYVLLGFGVLSVIVSDGPDIKERLIGTVAISVPMFLLAWLLNGFGGGDVKLMFAAGFLLGWKGILAAFFIGAIGGGVYGVYLLASKKKGRKEYFAFGPFLSVGIMISMFQGFGASMVQAYIDSFKIFLSLQV